ncbi:hypothetical protein ACP275_08G086400 [Erythranthe tilingii]
MIDSSPSSSAESSFRELDQAFLQTQTRIWIGEVLNTRFDEDNLNISDLLQDGEILFEVSKAVWNLLLTKCMELRHLKHKYGPFGSKTSSGRYKPYSNVDSFLKTCKILGLSGIDLFSPSDVVEKRDVRKVCICIRALSKKARSKHLSVPDFDVVICSSVAMPTDMVGVIRKSLESPQCSTLSSSSSFISRNTPLKKPEKKKYYAPYDRNGDYSSSEESDEAESRYMGEYSFSSVNSDIESSPEAQNVLELDTQKKEEGRKSKNATAVEDSPCIGIGENNYISDYLAFSDLMVLHATDDGGSINNPVIPDGGNNIFDFFLNVDSQGLVQSGSHKKLSDDEEMEVSSTTSMSSVLGRLLNLEFDEHFDEDDSSSAIVCSSSSKESKVEKQYKQDPFVLSEYKKTDTCQDASTEYLFLSEEKIELSGLGFLEGGSCRTEISNPENGDFCLENRDMVISDVTSEYFEFACKGNPVEESGESNEQVENMNIQDYSIQDSHLVFSNDTSFCGYIPENVNQDKTKDDPFILTQSITDRTKDENPPQPNTNRNRRPLLKTVFKGTAIAGALLLFLHIRKSNGNKNEHETKHQFPKHSKSKPSSIEQQQKTRTRNGIYPSQKLKL